MIFFLDFGVSSEPSSLDIDLLNYDSGIEAEIEENKGWILIQLVFLNLDSSTDIKFFCVPYCKVLVFMHGTSLYLMLLYHTNHKWFVRKGVNLILGLLSPL